MLLSLLNQSAFVLELYLYCIPRVFVLYPKRKREQYLESLQMLALGDMYSWHVQDSTFSMLWESFVVHDAFQISLSCEWMNRSTFPLTVGYCYAVSCSCVISRWSCEQDLEKAR